MSVESGNLQCLFELIDELCGIYLDDSKTYLIDARLRAVASRHGCSDYSELVSLARRPGREGLCSEIVDAITTNETLFFRDNSPFEALRHKILPDYIDQAESGRRPRRLRFWSAACSTGQEPYSIAMTLREVIPDVDNWQIEILATDVSREAIDQASAGIYSKLEVSRGIDQAALSAYFTEEPECWRVRDDLKRMVRFETRNLLKPILESDYFDIVFCRNVAIYFQPTERDRMFERLTNAMTDDGYLFVGSAESLGHLGARFSPQNHCNCTVYRPNQAGVLQ